MSKAPSKTLAKTSEQSVEQDYQKLLGNVQDYIRQARLEAALSVNRQVLLLNHRIGSAINQRRKEQGWGRQVVKDLARDLKRDGYKGFGQSNLFSMAAFASEYSEKELFHPWMESLGWSAHRLLLERIKDPQIRRWYMECSVENGWTKRTLQAQINTDLHLRQGKALTNFSDALPGIHGEAAQEIVKSEYNFELLNLNKESKERDIENQLINSVQEMLQELGQGFALIGRQYSFTEGEQDFLIDLLFYHTKLHCYVVIELKNEPFKPEFAGKLGFYISSIDDIEVTKGDAPTIGLLLCPNYNEVIVDRTLGNQKSPMAVATIKQALRDSLPKELREGIPAGLLDK